MMAQLLYVFSFAVFITASVNSDNVGYYTIPEPEIVAFEGGGLRVTLNDDSGISVFRFHGNVNENMKQLYPGSINLETSAKRNGKWILEDRNIKVRAGDNINYWVFVEKDRLGFIKQPVEHRIRELVPYYSEGGYSTTTYRPITTRRPTTAPTTTEYTTLVPCTTPMPNENAISNLQKQIDALNRRLDLVTSITALQGQVDILAQKFDKIGTNLPPQNEFRNVSRTIEQIMQTLENIPETRRLTLSGLLPPDLEGNPEQTVLLVVWEKLGLKVHVIAAVRKNDNTIVFELKTLQEKFDVLNAAAEKLKNSKLIFS